MGNSTTKLQDVIAYAKAKGIPVPTDQPGGAGTALALKMANDVMGDIIAERFNPKFNRAAATPFLTNSYQQDYPQVGLVNIGWGEDCDKLDINNTAIPKPLNQPWGITWRKQLSRTSLSLWPVREICWMYNNELSYGTWPGATKTFYPLVTNGPIQTNPIMSMIDANGNLLIVNNIASAPIVTGANAPLLAANSPEGTTVMDGTVQWIVVAPMSQGFRVFPLPGSSGPVYQITPYYQQKLTLLTSLGSVINPLPDEYSRFFQVGFEIMCKQGSPNAADRAEGLREYPLWLKALEAYIKQGNREPDAYSAIPASGVVESVYAGWSGLRNPQDPSQPY